MSLYAPYTKEHLLHSFRHLYSFTAIQEPEVVKQLSYSKKMGYTNVKNIGGIASYTGKVEK